VDLFETTRQEEIVGVGGDERMSGRQDREAEEHEGADDVVAILTVFGQGQDDVAAQELLLGVLEQGDESLLRSRLDEARRHLEVKALAPQGALPAPVPRRRQFHDENQTRRGLVRHFHQFRTRNGVAGLNAVVVLLLMMLLLMLL